MSCLDVMARGLGSPIGRCAGCVRAVVGIGVALALVTPAAAAALDQASDLESTPWTLVEYVGADGTAQPVLPGTEITAIFQDGRIGGSAGCNSYVGAYTMTGDAIRFSNTASTFRLCIAPPGIMEQEAAYLAALANTARLSVTPAGMTLRDSNGAMLLSFVPQPQTPLEGTAWTAEEYNNGRGGVVTLIEGTEITARFEDGRVAGSAGCNRYTAAYTLNGTAIEIGPGASTRMACLTPPGIMEQEAAYLAALQTARVYRIEGSRLILETADGARVASFVPAAGTEGAGASGGLPGDGSTKLSFDSIHGAEEAAHGVSGLFGDLFREEVAGVQRAPLNVMGPGSPERERAALRDVPGIQRPLRAP